MFHLLIFLCIAKFDKHIINIKSSTKTFYKLTVDCFKSISMSSNSEVGKLTKLHLVEMKQIIENYKIKFILIANISY